MNYSVFSTSPRNDSLRVYDARSHYANMQKKAPSKEILIYSVYRVYWRMTFFLFFSSNVSIKLQQCGNQKHNFVDTMK